MHSAGSWINSCEGVSFSPKVLAIAPRPLEVELASSWIERVAGANFVRLQQLLTAMVQRYPELQTSGNVCLDHGLSAVWRRAFAEWCRVGEPQIAALDLGRLFPGRDRTWFSHCADLGGSEPDPMGWFVWWTAAKFCPRCLCLQVRSGLPIHRRAEWALAFMTHCPKHFGEPLSQHCLCCHRQDPGWMIVRSREGDEVCCRYCAVALRHWPHADSSPLSSSLQVTLRLESTLLGCLRGLPPDPFWTGEIDAETFVALIAELLTLLTQRDHEGVLTLADHLAAVDWWDDHVLGYTTATALERQE